MAYIRYCQGVLCVALVFVGYHQNVTAASDRFDLGVVEVAGEKYAGLEQPKVDILSSEDMRKHNRTQLGDALNLLPGVTVQNVGNRSENLIFVRGFNSRQVPLFIDGIPVYIPYDGNIDLSRFTIADIAEINVAKGFTSVLYGANTMGGAINLVSRRPSRKLEGDITTGIRLDSEFDIGQYQTDFNIGSNQGLWYAQIGGAYQNQDFFSLPRDFTPTPAEDGGRRENSANRDKKISFKIGLTPNATDEYALSYYNQQGMKQTPPYAGNDPAVRTRFWRWPEYDKESIYFISKTQLGNDNYIRLRAYYDTFTNTLNSFDDATFTTQNRPFAFQGSVYDDYTAGGGIEFGTEYFDRHLIKVAFNYKRDVHRETDDLTSPTERFEDEVISAGIEDTISVTDKLTLITGASYDYQRGIQADENRNGVILPFPTDSQDAFNIQGGGFYQLDDVTRLHATVGKRTRFPTIKDRYSSRFGSAEPNPGLDPETAINTEIGIKSSVSKLDYGASLFWSFIDDAIEDVTLPPTCPNPTCSQLQNIGKQENRGIELYTDLWLTEQLRWHADWTFLDRKNKSAPDVRLLDTPRHKLFSYIEYQVLPWLSLLGSIEYQSGRFSDTLGERQTNSFVVGNLHAGIKLPAGFETRLGVHNVGDTNFAYQEGFPEPGRTYYANLRFNF